MSPLSLDWCLTGSDGTMAWRTSQGALATYADVRKRVQAVADQLAAAGAAPGRAVGIARRAPEDLLVGCLAAWSLGAVVWPVDLRLAPDAIDALVARVEPACLWTEKGVEARAEHETHDQSAGLLLFTSGSSGPPKGVLLKRDGLAANVEAIASYLPVRECPTTAVVLPLVYSYALVGQALTTLRVGGTLLLLNDVPYPTQQLELMARADTRLGLSSVPTSLRLLARTWLELPERPPLQFGYLASAGAPLDTGTLELVRQAFPGVRLFNQYGLTEASPRVTAISDDSPVFALGSVGRALPGLQVFAVSPSGERLPSGASGELAVRGPSVMLGYLDDHSGTHRVLAADGTLRTGDSGHVDADGYVFVEGRHDGVVKIAGERVGLDEVAAALREALTGVELQVVALPDEVLGSRLVVFVEGDEAVVSRVRRAARDHLPPHRRPARILALANLPTTLNGKSDLKALRALAEHV